jgi:hypothetical protein
MFSYSTAAAPPARISPDAPGCQHRPLPDPDPVMDTAQIAGRLPVRLPGLELALKVYCVEGGY